MKVLLVDDDVELRETYQDVLEADGHEVMGVASAAEALTRMPRFAPEVILLDMQIKGGTGEVVLLFIRQIPKLSTSRVYIISGYPERASYAAERWSATGWMAKPVSPASLRAVVRGEAVPEQDK